MDSYRNLDPAGVRGVVFDIDVTPSDKQVPPKAASRAEDAEVVDKVETK